MTFQPQKRGVVAPSTPGSLRTDTATGRFTTALVPTCRQCGQRNWTRTMVLGDGGVAKTVIMCATCNHLQGERGIEVH